jgi:hypothetical protein
MNTRKVIPALTVMAVLILAASCATLSNWGTTDPPIARVKVFNFSEYTDIGITTEISFSVTNVTDQDLTGLTLAVTQNPSNGLKLPFTEMTIERIPAHGTWKPDKAFLVTGKKAGSTVVFFTVTKGGEFLAKDYGTVNVSPDEDFNRHDFDRVR